MRLLPVENNLAGKSSHNGTEKMDAGQIDRAEQLVIQRLYIGFS
jgi:hypothetical protein